MPAFRITASPANPGLHLYPLLCLDPGCLGEVPVSFYPLPFPVATETLSLDELRGSTGGWAKIRRASEYCLSTFSLQNTHHLFSTGLPSACQCSQASLVPFFNRRWWQAARHRQLKSFKTKKEKASKSWSIPSVEVQSALPFLCWKGSVDHGSNPVNSLA